MATALDIITDALSDIGAIDPLEALTTEELNHGLRKLNEMLELWSLDSLSVYQVLQENFPTVAATATYTIGTGGAWNTERPVRIESAFVREAGLDYPVYVLQRDAYDSIPLKTVQSRPERLYYDPAFPLATVLLYYTPDKAYTVFINSYKRLQNFPNLTTVVSLPPGYLSTIKSNLSLQLAPSYHRPASEELKESARMSKALVKALHIRTPVLSVRHVSFGRGHASGRAEFTSGL